MQCLNALAVKTVLKKCFNEGKLTFSVQHNEPISLVGIKEQLAINFEQCLFGAIPCQRSEKKGQCQKVDFF